jgi:hypothetical protein
MLTFWAIAALSGGHGPQWRQSAVKGSKLTLRKRCSSRNDQPAFRVVGRLAILGLSMREGGCMEIDRASTQRLVAKLGVTVGFLFLLAIIALAFT